MSKKMKKFRALSFLLILPVFFSCAGGGKSKNVNIGDIQGRDWILEEIKTGATVVRINRAQPGITEETFSIRFDTERISGMAAPNRYFGPYTAGDNNALAIGTVAGTLMASIFEPEELKEYEYYAYLGRVTSWEINAGKLELHTSNESGIQVVLVFR